MIRGIASAGVDALATDADDLAIRDAPLLAGSAIAGHYDYRRAISCGAPLNVETTTTDAGNLAIADGPLLVGTAMAVKQAHRRAISGVAVGHIDALAAVGADELGGMPNGCAHNNNQKTQKGTRFVHEHSSIHDLTMMRRSLSLVCAVIAAFFLVGNRSVASDVVASATSDPFAYCSAIGSVETPAGGSSPVPMALKPFLSRALGLPAGRDLRPESYYWRCMNGMVFVCAIGANIPCGAKADLAKRNLGADKYCQDNPEAAFVPAYATGHETLFAWSCSLGHAVPGKRIAKLDARGYRIDIWHKVLRDPLLRDPP
jgi:hypothetical protein